MSRLSLMLMLVACVGLFSGIAVAQDADSVASGGTVRGEIIVFDKTTARNPIPGVRVLIANHTNTFEVTTDKDGIYVCSGLPAGRYLISIYKEGYHDRIGKPVKVVDGGKHRVDLGMTKAGLPVGILVLLAGAILFFACIIGAAIWWFYGRNRKGD